MMTPQLHRLTDHFVAEVCGLRSEELAEPATCELLRKALVEHQVLVVRGMQLTPELLVAFGRCWGELRTETAHPSVPHLEALTPISNTAEWGHLGVGTRWHSDGMFLPRRSRFSMLYAHRPAVSGGETWFCDSYRAYETLDPEIRSVIEGKLACHMTGFRAPLVIVHPDTGRKALYVNLESTTSVRGLPIYKSVPVLDHLGEHLSRPELVYRHQYREGDLVIHDGFSTMHRVTPGHTEGLRILYRVTTLGDGPEAAGPA